MTAEAMDALAAALEAESRALIDNDADRLLSANDAKLVALRQLQLGAGAGVSPQRLHELMERNRANGVLLARRQRQVRWALRHLGRVDGQQNYGANGRVATYTERRALGIG